MDIKTVTVIGVTGTMGANIAGIFASFGNAKVYCIGRDIEKVKKTIPRIVKSVKADAIAKNLIPADFSMLEKCVADSDLIFESRKEDINVELNDGYLTITAVKGHEEDEKNKAGKIIRQERYSGSMSRSFYVGDTLTVDEIHGKYEGGVLTLNIPKKEEEKKVEHPNRIMIE